MTQKKFTVYGASSHSPMHTETPASAAQYTVMAENCFDAMGKANVAAKRCGIDFKDMKYFEVKEARDA